MLWRNVLTPHAVEVPVQVEPTVIVLHVLSVRHCGSCKAAKGWRQPQNYQGMFGNPVASPQAGQRRATERRRLPRT